MNRSGESYQRTNDIPSHAGKMPHSVPAVLPTRGRPSKVNRGGMRTGMQYQNRRHDNMKQSGSRMLIPVPTVDRVSPCDKDNHGTDNTPSPDDNHTKPDVQVPPDVIETNAPSVINKDTNETKPSISVSSPSENNSDFNDKSYQISEQESKELKAIENEQKNKRKDEEELRRLEVERAGQNRHHYYGGARVINNNPHGNSNGPNRFINHNRYIPQRDYYLQQKGENKPAFINPNPPRRNYGYSHRYEQRRPQQMLSRRPSHHILPPHPRNPPQQKSQPIDEVVVEDTNKASVPPKVESVPEVKSMKPRPQDPASEVVTEQSEKSSITATPSTTVTPSTPSTTSTTPKETQSLGFYLEGDDSLVVKRELDAWKTKGSANDSSSGETVSDCGFVLQDGPEQPPQPTPNEAYPMFYQAPYAQFCGYPYPMNYYYVPVDYSSWKPGYMAYPG